MELFTLGGGYTERDVRKAARALTGWRGEVDERAASAASATTPSATTAAVKTDPRPARALRLPTTCSARRRPTVPRAVPRRASCGSFFVTHAAGPRDRRKRLAHVYTPSGTGSSRWSRRSSAHPALYADLDSAGHGQGPVVFVAGALRTAGVPRSTATAWTWLLDEHGPAAVPTRRRSPAGTWGPAWMSTNSMRARFVAVNYLLDESAARARERRRRRARRLSRGRRGRAALDAARAPVDLIGPTRELLDRWRATAYDDMTKPWQVRQRPDRAEMLQRALRH